MLEKPQINGGSIWGNRGANREGCKHCTKFNSSDVCQFKEKEDFPEEEKGFMWSSGLLQVLVQAPDFTLDIKQEFNLHQPCNQSHLFLYLVESVRFIDHLVIYGF